jgi:hypothetical protein
VKIYANNEYQINSKKQHQLPQFKYIDGFIIENVNHKALVISVIFAAALVAEVYSTSTQAALADSVNQKNCHAVVISNSSL